MTASEIILAIVGAAVTGLAGTGIGLLVALIKKAKFVKALGIEGVIDRAAEMAINAAESWGRNMLKGKADKLNKAKEAFQAELARQGVKLDAGQIEDRLEAIFNHIKAEVEKNGG